MARSAASDGSRSLQSGPDGVLQQRSGRINHDVSCAPPTAIIWFVAKARLVINAEGEVVRVIGRFVDVTEIKTGGRAHAA